ncbi:hypothetical protein ACGFJ4_16365 [Micromonospora chalcea]|uniref:hypothetical protein n=1 Tax=Micromonospora chalcea TaxID=1874 RepID=UPI0037186F31
MSTAVKAFDVLGSLGAGLELAAFTLAGRTDLSHCPSLPDNGAVSTTEPSDRPRAKPSAHSTVHAVLSGSAPA